MKMFSYTDGGTQQPHTERDPLQTRLAAVAELDYIMAPQTETEIDVVTRMTTAARKLELGAPDTQDTAPPLAPPAPSSPPPSRDQITRDAMLAVLTSLATDNRIAGETRCRAATMYLQHTVSASKTQTLSDREERLATATPRSQQMTTAAMRKATRPVTATSGPKPPTPKQRATNTSKIKTSSSSPRSKASKASAPRKPRAATSRRTA